MANFSKFGFILATLGSSIGLGHIWRFPYMTGSNGGSAFVVLYLFLTLTIGISMLLSDMIIGNRGRKNMVSCFEGLYKKNLFIKFSGVFLLGGPIIMSFYSVVLGWVLYYLFVVSFDLPKTLLQSQQMFLELKESSIYWQFLGFSFCLILTSWIVCFGIKKGIEKLNFVLMPLLFIIFIGLLIYAMSMPSFDQAFRFMFDFAPQKITLKVVIESLGQVFFSLSLGVGTIITYAAFTHKSENLLKSSLWVVIPGILISLIAGLMIFTFIFEYGGSAQQGDGLVFISLPLVFGQMGLSGEVISILFLIALMFAGITSTVSLLEPSVVYLIERFQIRRFFATFIVSVCVFILGVLIIFSLNVDYAQTLTFLNKNIFMWADFLTSSVLMPLGGLFSIVFVGYVVGRKKAYEYTKHFLPRKMFGVWFFLVRYVIPLVIVIILVSQILHSF
ncbi:sodium-dependent transporter [Helicobacter cappadocius]|uniref:Sodium-dependent transporter n=1 Tax=Helicobacter cappadocius TaxID=3063998 RepID=A0AA90PQK9_9HELI|nr:MULTISPECIES: sodium-dependent transporter [unclassified Helicobacter]MDO7253005.1 sodium-dependent transporter [Helicobacter sp. faydin-H75]MDP2539006.1 sodium-dependent transporter [Helicobacter sp. faydin-H76]